MTDLKAIGIDLGTTYCRVAVFKNGRIEVLTNEIASNLTPSYVSFTEKLCLVGDSAKNQVAMNAKNTICGIRRLIGRKYSNNIPGSKYWPFRVNNDEKRAKIFAQYRGKTKELCPEQVTAILLGKMKKMAEEYLGHPVQNAVLTVPAHFNNSQRLAIKQAGLVAGLKPALINETTAAALAYVYDKEGELAGRERTVLVYNLGGGFLDVSLMIIKNLQVQVKATASDCSLGGEDFDNRLIDYCVSEFKLKHGKDLSTSPRALCRLRRACEKAKRDLSFTVSASIEIDELFEGLDFFLDISRKTLEELCADLFQRTMVPVMNSLHDANVDKGIVDEVLIVGGSTRIPFLQKRLSDYFGDRKLNMSMNPDLAAVIGSTVYGGKECQEKCVQDIGFVDVISSSYGMDVENGSYEKIVKKNSPIPIECTTNYYAKIPNILINILQGEKKRTEENTFLGQYRLQATMGGRKELEFKVFFKVDRHGILTASGVLDGVFSEFELPSEKFKLSPGELIVFTKELEQFEEDERNEKLRVEAKNNLQGSIDKLQQNLDAGLIALEAREEVRVVQDKIVSWLDDNNDADKKKFEDVHQRYRDLLQEAVNRPMRFIDERREKKAPIPKQYPGTAHPVSSVKIEERPPSRSYADVAKTNMDLNPAAQQVSYRDTTVSYFGVYSQDSRRDTQATRRRPTHKPYYSTYQASYGNQQEGYHSTSANYSTNYQPAYQQPHQNYGSNGYFR